MDDDIYEFNVSLEHDPISAARPRFFLGRAVLSKNYAAYRKELAEKFNEYAGKERYKTLFETKPKNGFMVDIIFYFTPLKDNKKKLVYKKSRPDADNLYKAVIDALMASELNPLYIKHDWRKAATIPSKEDKNYNKKMENFEPDDPSWPTRVRKLFGKDVKEVKKPVIVPVNDDSFFVDVRIRKLYAFEEHKVGFEMRIKRI